MPPTCANPVTSAQCQAALAMQGQVLVLGLGASGLSMARWCARCGAQVTVADTRDAPPQLAALQSSVPTARFIAGAFTAGLLDGTPCALFKSPGLTPAQCAPVSTAAQARGLWVSGEIDLFASALEKLRAHCGYTPKVLAITGTNGKTTVTSLTAQLVARCGKSVALAGNIGPALLDTLAQHLAQQTLPEVWVLELSSFQLASASAFAPSAAALLNLTQDHLDWHGSMAAYAQAKAAVFGQQGLGVLNCDDAAVMALWAAQQPAPATKARAKPARRMLRFGTAPPGHAGDLGLQSIQGLRWLVRACSEDSTHSQQQRPPELFMQALLPLEALQIRGQHNALNALAALALASAAGCALAPLLYGLRDYRGEAHRMQSVGVHRGVEYFDDSKGTNVGATVAALNSLGAERRLLLILGGVGKGQDFRPLAQPVRQHARAALLIGRDGASIAEALADTGVPLLHAASMFDAVKQASTLAQAGDAVLLSPACASFDMFDNYEHRAQVFVQAFRALTSGAGAATEAAL